MANDLTRRNNFLDNMMNMRNWMNDDFFSDLAPVADHMKTDIAETEKEYRVKVDMPGFAKKDIHIDYANNILSITGHRDTFSDDADKNGNVLHSERRYGQMSRQYRLPDVDRSAIKARYEDGVLILNLPKLQADNNNDSHIEIE